MTEILIKEASVEDAGLILRFIKELASYERAEHEVTAQLDDIEKSIFGHSSTVECIICYQGEEPIGFAVYFYNYSTWLGKNGLYLEDLFVLPAYRNFGAGKAILRYLSQKAVAKGCGRFEWSVLDWNEPAINFYKSIGAKPKEGWIGYQLSGEDLVNFSQS